MTPTPVIDVISDENLLHDAAASGALTAMAEGVYPLTRPLVVCPPKGAPTGLKFCGAGQELTRFVYTGPADRPAVSFASCFYPQRIAGFTVRSGFGQLAVPTNQTDADAATVPGGIGIAFGYDGKPGAGTQFSGGPIQGVLVDGFGVGVQLGNNALGTAASELVFDQLLVSNCREAARVEGGGNALSIRFRMLKLANCWDGVHVVSGGNVFVEGGSGNNVGQVSGAVWDHGSVLRVGWAGTFAVRDFWLENSASGRLLSDMVKEARTVVSVTGCTVSAREVPDAPQRFMAFAQGNASLTFAGNTATTPGVGGVRWYTGKGYPAGKLRCEGNAVRAGSPVFADMGDNPKGVRQLAPLAANDAIDANGVPVG